MRPVIEPAVGVPNGVRTDFETTASYLPGSVKVFVNGLVMRADYVDGWIELGAKKIRLKEPPQDRDVVQFFYLVA